MVWCTAKEQNPMRKPREITVAAVRSGVVSTLIKELILLDEELSRSLPAGGYAVTLAAPSSLKRKISFNGGKRGALLWFPRHRDMTAVLSGGKGALLPLPTGPGFFRALNAFRKSAVAVASAMDAEPDLSDTPALEKKTRLLLKAALSGVCEVYNHDHWTAARASHIPQGRIGIGVAGRKDVSGVLAVGKGFMSLEENPSEERVNAFLEFRDVPVCHAVLTGAEPALGALGEGRVMTKGKLAMIQGLFPLLDRFGEIMK
jgi:hypothetical protein